MIIMNKMIVVVNHLKKCIKNKKKKYGQTFLKNNVGKS